MMMKLPPLLFALFLSCGEYGRLGTDGDALSQETQIPPKFREQICGGSNPEFQYKFKLNASPGANQLLEQLEDGLFQGPTLRSFISRKGSSDGMLYIEEKEQGRYNVVVNVCDRPNGKLYDFEIKAFGLSNEASRCPPHQDISSATLTFKRQDDNSSGRSASVIENEFFYFTPFSCN